MFSSSRFGGFEIGVEYGVEYREAISLSD